MTRTVRHATTMLAALALGLFGVAAAQDVITFEDLDEDGDAELVAAEIGVLEDRGLYDGLDENDNEIVVAIGETVIHEFGHYFGLSEEEIEEIEERYWRGDRD